VTVVLLNGRRLPPGDWEGDDLTPGSNGHYVTCTDTALGRDIAYATNGRIDRDGRVYRAAVSPDDHDGINLWQARQAAKAVANVSLVLPSGWEWSNALAHLKNDGGLILQGWYAEIPRALRFQAGAEFGHAMWASHYNRTNGVRVWDPLDPNTSHHGQWITATYVKNFLERFQQEVKAGSLLVAYAPLQPL
jgi:hypothetical protein